MGKFMAESGQERRLAAIVQADVVGYSRLIGLDEEGTLDRLRAHCNAHLVSDVAVGAHNLAATCRGAWINVPRYLRSATRSSAADYYAGSAIGFRIAQDIPD